MTANEHKHAYEMTLNSQYFWNAQKDALRRIRDDLSSTRSNSTSPSYRNHPSSPLRYSPISNTHAPHGIISPALPRLHTPPSHEKRRANQNLREKKLSKVPPVVPRLSFIGHSDDDSDSWGDDSDNEPDIAQTHYPQMSYPVPFMLPQPGIIYPHQPIAVPWYYPTYPAYPRRRKKAPKLPTSSLKKSDRFADFYSSLEFENHRQTNDYKNVGNSKTVTFQSPLFEAYSPSVRGDYTPRRSADFVSPSLHPFDYFLSHPYFAEEFVTDFIDDCVVTDFVPDILLDTLDKWQPPNRVPTDTRLAVLIYDAIFDDVIRELVSESSREIAIGIVNSSRKPLDDPLEEFLDDVTESAITLAIRVVVKETIQEMAGELMRSNVIKNIVADWVDDNIADIMYDLVDEVTWELSAEDVIDDLVLSPEITELAVDVAVETLQHYDSKVYRRELKEVKKLCNNKLMDSFFLHHLLTKIANQENIFTENALADKALDSAMANILLKQMFHVKEQRSETIDNSAMRKLHQRAAANVAVDMMLDQLSASLDEDMCDVDECERGLTQFDVPCEKNASNSMKSTSS